MAWQRVRKRAESRSRQSGQVFALVAPHMRTLALVAIVGGCASYDPGSFSYPSRRFPGERVSVGCLDISVDRRADFDGKVVLDYQFGNRCNEPVLIDLLRVPVTGRTVDGDEITLTPFDPNFEMIAMKIDARKAGGEAIAYPTTQPLVQVCANAGALGEPKETRWLCFAGRGEIAPVPEAATEVARADADRSMEVSP